MKKLLQYIILFVLLLSSPLWALEGPYYFSNDGDDGNTGLSDAQAWENPGVKLDNQSFDDGTDFYFKQGDTFTITTGDIDINHSGVDSANYAIFGCYESTGDFDCSGARPIIQQSNDNQTLFYVGNNDYLRFEHLYMTCSSEDWEDAQGGGSNQGIYTATEYTGDGYITVNDCYFYHFGHYSIAFIRQGTHYIVTNNTFDTVGNAIYFIQEAGNGTYGASYNYIAGNTCDNIVGYATAANPGTKLDGHCAGLQSVQNTILEDNTVTDARGPIVLWSKDDDYIRDNVVRNNTVIDGIKGSLYVSGGDEDQAASYRNLVYGNILSGSQQSASYGMAIRFGHITGIGNRAFNNTIYNAQLAGIGAYRYSSNLSFQNNIVHTNDFGTALLRFEDNPSDPFYADYNLYWTTLGDPSSSSLWMDTNLGSYDWSDWTTSRSNDTHGDVDNPDFTAPGSNDFTLQSDSPAINTGGYLSYVTTVSGTTITVADTYWFHGDFGLVDEDGNAITGMEITFYDTTYGHQDRTITSDTISHGTPGTFVINTALSGYIYNGSYPNDPDYTTQIGLTFYGVAPDIGAEEYNLNISDALPQGAGASITTGLSWSKPSGQTDTDVHFKAGSTPCTFDAGDIVQTGDVESVSNALLGGELSVDTDYCWDVVVNPDDENVQNGPYYFSTAEGPPPPTTNKPKILWK